MITPATVTVTLPWAEYEALLAHLRDTARTGDWHYAGSLADLDLAGAVRTLEAAPRLQAQREVAP
jgi:hypothetical protein